MKDFYIAAAKGILHCRADGAFCQEIRGFYPVPAPSFLYIEDDMLYALLREPFRMQSGVCSFRISPDGSLSPEGELLPTHGAVAAELAVRRGSIYAVNYLSGSTVKLPDKAAIYHGRGPDPDRQESSHPHGLCFSPDGSMLAVADLGTDSIYFHAADLRLLYTVKLPAGCGPRQLRFSADGKTLYCVTELASTLELLRPENGKYRHSGSFSTLPGDFDGENYASALALSADGALLYVSNRGHDSIAVFDLRGPSPRPLAFVPTAGRWPRHFALAGDMLLCANEKSDSLCFFSLRDGIPEYRGFSLAAESPVCVICREN